MPNHLTEELIARYRMHELAPQELILVMDHVSACALCRSELTRAGDVKRVMEAVTSGAHLRYEQIERLASGEIAIDQDVLLEHLAECPNCSAEVRDLTAFRGELLQTPKARRNAWRWLVPVGVAAALATVVFALLPRSAVNLPSPEPSSPVIASLRDHAASVQLHESGALSGINTGTAELKVAIANALRSGELAVGADKDLLTKHGETLLGSESRPAATLTPVGPVGTVVADDRPEFRWTASPGSTKFVISVYTEDFQLAAQSPSLDSTSWHPVQALKRNLIYTWTVSAVVHGVKVTAPRSPEPEARFRVASEEEAARLDRVRGSDLAVAVSAASMGMLGDAARALERLRQQNPGSQEIVRLIAKLDRK